MNERRTPKMVQIRLKNPRVPSNFLSRFFHYLRSHPSVAHPFFVFGRTVGMVKQLLGQAVKSSAVGSLSGTRAKIQFTPWVKCQGVLFQKFLTSDLLGGLEFFFDFVVFVGETIDFGGIVVVIRLCSPIHGDPRVVNDRGVLKELIWISGYSISSSAHFLLAENGLQKPPKYLQRWVWVKH